MSHITLLPGDNRVSLAALSDNSVDSCVCDPPYGLVSIQKRFGKEGSAPARREKNDGSFARVSGGFMGKCYHPDTEVLTKSGWINIRAAKVGDVIATLNPDARSVEWQAIEQIHQYPFDGEMVHIRHRSSEQMITPNHKMLASHDGGETLELLTPSQLKSHFHIFAQAEPQAGRTEPVSVVSARDFGKDRAETRYERRKFEASAFFRFLGLWLGDGYTCTRRDDHPANDFFGFAVKKPRKIEAIRAALLDLGIRFTETPPNGDGNTNFYCYDFALLGWLKNLGGSKEKHIPEHLFDWDASVLENLYEGLIETDGCRQGKDQEIYHTTSRRLADDFQRLCLHTGRSASVSLRPGGKEVFIGDHKTITSDSWVCCVLQRGKRMYGEKSVRGSNVVFEAPYAGDVFCVGVRKHHIIYTRFNGKPVWSGNSWDSTGIENDPAFWAEVLRVLKPGAYIVAFSSSRTFHRMATAIEDAGFITHPMIGWCYGQGFPKAHAADKAIDKLLGKSGHVVPSGDPVKRMIPGADQNKTGWEKNNGREYQPGSYMPATDEAAEWQGWAYGGQARKPALEPIYVGQKPFSEKSGAANILRWGVGAVNVDGCRVPADGRPMRVGDYKATNNNVYSGRMDGSLAGGSKATGTTDVGRHPANLIHDGSPEVVALFPDSKGQQGAVRGDEPSSPTQDIYGKFNGRVPAPIRGDNGSAARFFECYPFDGQPIFYHPKAGKEDRAGGKHPTVKPIGLMQALVRHVTPPGGTVLDPFAGSGTTGEACLREGFDCILMEAEPEYVSFLRRRFGGSLDQSREEVIHKGVLEYVELLGVKVDR